MGMKKSLGILITLLMVVSLSACGNKVAPKDAITNTSNAKQGKILMSMKVTSNTGNTPEEVKLLLDSIYGSSDDNKKSAVECTLTANYQGKSLEGKMDLSVDLTEKEPKISLEAGVPASTLANLGTSAPSAIVVTLNEADFQKLLKSQNIDFNSTVNAKALKNNAEILAKVMKAFSDLKIEDPKDAGSGSITMEGRTYEGEKYTVHLTDDQIKGVIKALVKIGMDAEKTNDKTGSTTSNKNIPTEQEINAQLDTAFKSITFKDGINGTMIVDKDGYLNYIGVTMGLNEPTSKTDIALDLALGFSDLNSSVKGLEYYDKNKTGMYKDATVIPIMKYIDGTTGSNQNTSSAASLFGLGN